MFLSLCLILSVLDRLLSKLMSFWIAYYPKLLSDINSGFIDSLFINGSSMKWQANYEVLYALNDPLRAQRRRIRRTNSQSWKETFHVPSAT